MRTRSAHSASDSPQVEQRPSKRNETPFATPDVETSSPTRARAGVIREALGQTSRSEDLARLEHEIQRRQNMESTLQDSEARFRLLYDNNPSMYFTLSPDGTVVSVNQFGANQLGYRLDELTGQTVLNVFAPEDHQTVLGQLAVCACSPLKVFQWEIQKVRKDGTTLWVRERAQAVQDHQGQILVLVVCEDITERRQAEEQIRESEDRWRAFYEHAGVGIAQLALDGRFLRVNPRLCETLGYSAKTMLQRSFQELTHPDDLQPNLHRLHELAAGTKPSFSMEKRYRRSDDTWIWVNLTVSLVRTASQAPAYFIAIVEDIAERKHTEALLRESEEAIRSLHEMTSRPGLTFEQRVQTLLELGCRRFKLPVGMLTSVQGDQLRVTHLWAPGTSFHPGMTLALCQSYCGTTLTTPGVLSIDHAGQSEWRSHPGYQALALESYLGTKLQGQQTLYGTICFLSRDAHPTPFTEADKDFLLLMAQWVTGEFDRRRVEEGLEQINQCFLQFGSDPLANIQRLTTLGGELLGGTCALYSRLEGRLLCSIAQWEAPPDYRAVDEAEGHICCDLIRRGKDGSLTVRHLSQTPYAETDPNVKRYGLETYLGKVVSVGDEAVGSLCVVFQHDVVPTEADERLMGILASAIGTEEHRIREQAALRDSEERFRIAFRSSPYLVILTELESGRCLEVNDASLKLFGYSRDEVMGRTVLSLGLWPTPEDRARFFAAMRQHGMIRNHEIALRAKNGTPRQLLVSSEMIELDGLSCLLTVGNDITEQKHAEAALRESEERFAKAFRSSPSPVVISELETGLCLDANDAAITLFGYQRDEVAGRTADEIGLWPSAEHRRAFTKQLRERGAIRNVEVMLRMKSGVFRHCLVSAEQIELNGVSCMVTIGTDVTEQKRAEEALRASELRLQRFVSEAPVGLVILDEQRRLVSANKAFCQLTGYSEAELRGQTYDLYTHPDDLPYNRKLTDEFYQGLRQEYTIEKRYVRKRGDIIWVSVKATTIDLPNHSGPLLLAVVQDITERKRATEAKERLSQDLHDNLLQSLYAVGMQLEAAKLVADRSAKQSKQRMSHAIAQLNELVNDVRQFIALLKQDQPPAMDFRQALQRLADSFSSGSRAAIDLEIDQGAVEHVGSEQAVQLLNIAREALSNSVRHANASRHVLLVQQRPGALIMQISDDGKGFNLAQKRPRGHGLLNMAARARTIGAEFSLTSRPQQGTCVTITLPQEHPYGHL